MEERLKMTMKLDDVIKIFTRKTRWSESSLLCLNPDQKEDGLLSELNEWKVERDVVTGRRIEAEAKGRGTRTTPGGCSSSQVRIYTDSHSALSRSDDVSPGSNKYKISSNLGHKLNNENYCPKFLLTTTSIAYC